MWGGGGEGGRKFLFVQKKRIFFVPTDRQTDTKIHLHLHTFSQAKKDQTQCVAHAVHIARLWLETVAVDFRSDDLQSRLLEFFKLCGESLLCVCRVYVCVCMYVCALSHLMLQIVFQRTCLTGSEKNKKETNASSSSTHTHSFAHILARTLHLRQKHGVRHCHLHNPGRRQAACWCVLRRARIIAVTSAANHSDQRGRHLAHLRAAGRAGRAADLGESVCMCVCVCVCVCMYVCMYVYVCLCAYVLLKLRKCADSLKARSKQTKFLLIFIFFFA